MPLIDQCVQRCPMLKSTNKKCFGTRGKAVIKVGSSASEES